MTATQQSSTVVPWKVRWALIGLTAAAVLTMPGTVKAVGERGIHNLGSIFGVHDDTPIELSPTNPPVVNP